VLHDDTTIPVTLMVFDVLAVEGLSVTAQPYEDRRALLEELQIERPGAQVVATFEDGRKLFDAVCQRGLEGVDAKRLRDPYKPGERLWLTTKNRVTPRFAEERAQNASSMRKFRIPAGAAKYQLKIG
jgi:bifunctional non-homologous end joining protein LigD